MANIFDYLRWRGDLSFAQCGFNPIDGVILARLAYLPFDQLLPTQHTSALLRTAARTLLDAPERSFSEQDALLLTALAASPRFQTLQLTGYVNQLDEETQFSALTVRLSDEAAFLSFRGTDNTLVGWKEDFNMSFVCPVPAQELALRYLAARAAQLRGDLLLGGHSKGGNLAVYAAAFCAEATQLRVTGVYNFDGPGFDESVLQSPGYRRICARVQTFVPQSSIVGMLLGHEEQYSIVQSDQLGGIWQHNVYTWDVERTGFVCLEHVTNSSRFIDSTLKQWLKTTEPQQRELFFDTIYDILRQTNAKTMREMSDNWLLSAVSIAKSIKNLDEDTRKAVTHALGLLLKSTKTGFSSLSFSGRP